MPPFSVPWTSWRNVEGTAVWLAGAEQPSRVFRPFSKINRNGPRTANEVPGFHVRRVSFNERVNEQTK